MLSDMTDANPEQRAFYLSLDPQTGQALAEAGGFVPPSKAVMVKEQQEVIKGWMKLSALGFVDSIDQYIDWYLEILESATGMEVPDYLKEGYGESIRHLIMAIVLGIRRQGFISVTDEDAIEFQAFSMDPETGDILRPDADVEEAIADLEKSWHLELEEDEDG